MKRCQKGRTGKDKEHIETDDSFDRLEQDPKEANAKDDDQDNGEHQCLPIRKELFVIDPPNEILNVCSDKATQQVVQGEKLLSEKRGEMNEERRQQTLSHELPNRH